MTPLRKFLVDRGHVFDEKWASLRLIQEVFIASGERADDAKNIMEPLRTLHHLRTKVKGHSALSERRALESQARSEHGTFRNHFAHLAAGCDAAMRRITDLLAPDFRTASADE